MQPTPGGASCFSLIGCNLTLTRSHGLLIGVELADRPGRRKIIYRPSRPWPHFPHERLSTAQRDKHRFLLLLLPFQLYRSGGRSSRALVTFLFSELSFGSVRRRRPTYSALFCSTRLLPPSPPPQTPSPRRLRGFGQRSRLSRQPALYADDQASAGSPSAEPITFFWKRLCTT
jgi:hypothetical protein